MSEDNTSRVEKILHSLLGTIDPSDLQPTQSRVEALLLALNQKLEELGDLAGKLPIHICTSSEFNQLTGVPTIVNPEVNIFYLVPDGSGNDLYSEWIYTGDKWEYFGEKSQRAIDAADDARESAAIATEAAETALNVLASIPLDYSVMSEDVKSLKGGVGYGDDRLNELYGTINYGYDTPVDLPAGSTASTKVAVKRGMERIVLDADGALANNFVAKVNNDVQRASTSSQIDALTNGTQLVSGHTYQVRVQKISGTGTLDGAGYCPTAVVYKAGEHATVGMLVVQTDSEVVREFTADGSTYFICVYCKKACSISNFVLDLTLKDVADQSVYELIEPRQND